MMGRIIFIASIDGYDGFSILYTCKSGTEYLFLEIHAFCAFFLFAFFSLDNTGEQGTFSLLLVKGLDVKVLAEQF
jgi:hypothetical protein